MNFISIDGIANTVSNLLSRFRSNSKYHFGLNTIDAATKFNRYAHDKEKIAAVLTNPAMMKVISLQCDLFSMGAIKVVDQDGKEIENDPFLNIIKKPNPFQTQSQFLWDFMFWNMLGTSYTYVDSRIPDKIGGNKMYFLDPSKMHWPKSLQDNADKMVFSNDTEKLKAKQVIKYRYDDGTSQDVTLDKIIINTDLTTGIGNFYKGPSRIDALYKILSNSEFSLDAKNINVRYSGKFLVSAVNDISKIGLGETEKIDLENSVDTNDKKVWAYKVPINIRRFVDNLANLQLDQAYLADYFLVGNMYSIPRDVLEAYQSSTYENQEKARAAHVNYCLDPKGNAFMDSFENHFMYPEQGKNIVMSWDHLPFMQVFEKEKAEVRKVNMETFNSMISLGIDIDQVNEFLGTEFKIKSNGQGQNQEVGQGQDQSADQTNNG